MQKQRNVKIEHAGKVIYEASLPGAAKNKKGQYIRELMQQADELLPDTVLCELHYQQQGAKGWAVWYYCIGDENAYLIPPEKLKP